MCLRGKTKFMRRLYTLLTLAVLCIVSVSAATYIKGTQQATIDRMYQFVKSQNPSFDRTIAEKFYTVGAKYGIRGDIALCQSIVETGWFKYKNSISFKKCKRIKVLSIEY